MSEDVGNRSADPGCRMSWSDWCLLGGLFLVGIGLLMIFIELVMLLFELDLRGL